MELQDRGLRQREVVLRVTAADRDGDETRYDRVVASNPGFAQSFWVYCRMPTGSAGLEIAAHAAVEVEARAGEPEGLRGFEAGAVLARSVVDLSRAVPAGEGMYAVVGPAAMGLERYAGVETGAGGERSSPAGHESTRVAVGLSSAELPDRWHGLAGVGVVVWGRGESASPADLTADQARAVREWVARGGHLVVVFGAAGTVWLSEADNPLADLMPAIEPPLRREGVNLETYRALLTHADTGLLPASAVVHSFRRAAGAGAGEAMPILDGPGGDTVVVRRLVGSGAVTLVGLDLAAPALRSAGLPRAEAFWHRVLGRRGPLVGGAVELAELFGDDAARVSSRRDPTVFDGDFDAQIDTSRRAAAGVLMGFVVFGLYWLIAGPMGFWMLSRKGLRRHAWVAFAGAAGVFTAVGWGGATLIRPDAIEVQHLTILEQVHGQETQRAGGWGSVLIPWYGTARVGVSDLGYSSRAAEDLGLRRWHDLLAPWSPAGGGGLVGGFPDNRGYRVESRAPDSAEVPARSTVKQFRFDWAGAVRWATMAPASPQGEPTPARVALRGDGTLDGVLTHALPGDLEDVVLVWVTGQTRIGPRSPTDRSLPAIVRANKLSDPWPAGQRLDLLAATVGGEPIERYLDDLLASGRRLGLGSGGSLGGPIDDRLVALSLFSQLPPPDLRLDAQLGQIPVLATRSEAHGWDLSRWFTQPCLIVMGHMVARGVEDGGVVPLTVDGAAPMASGRTVVRWVYPLPADPPEWLARARGGGGIGVGP